MKHSSLLAILLLFLVGISFLSVGLVLGYMMRIDEETASLTQFPSVAHRAEQRVLGVSLEDYYTNPFSKLDAKGLIFPLVQLQGCRNFQECFDFCEQAENYQACVAWARSLEK